MMEMRQRHFHVILSPTWQDMSRLLLRSICQLSCTSYLTRIVTPQFCLSYVHLNLNSGLKDIKLCKYDQQLQPKIKQSNNGWVYPLIQWTTTSVPCIIVWTEWMVVGIKYAESIPDLYSGASQTVQIMSLHRDFKSKLVHSQNIKVTSILQLLTAPHVCYWPLPVVNYEIMLAPSWEASEPELPYE